MARSYRGQATRRGPRARIARPRPVSWRIGMRQQSYREAILGCAIALVLMAIVVGVLAVVLSR